MTKKWVTIKEYAELEGISIAQAYQRARKLPPERIKEGIMEYTIPKKQTLILIED